MMDVADGRVRVEALWNERYADVAIMENDRFDNNVARCLLQRTYGSKIDSLTSFNFTIFHPH